MSDIGSILDKLLAIAVAVDANYKTTRGVNLIATLNDEDFPHVFAYEPAVAITLESHLQENVAGDFTILIVTKGETQEQVLVRADAFRAAIQADRTLTGDVETAYVSAIAILEDPRSILKGAQISVTTAEVE